jgi:nitrilase
VFLDRDSTVDKACALIAEAGAAGAKLVVFPEAFIPTYPMWVWFIPPAQTKDLRELYAELHANAVSIPSPTTEQLGAAAKAAGLTVAIGVNERNDEASGTTLYNTLLYLGPDGNVIGKHRKLVPTVGERLVWGQGDGSTFGVVDTQVGRVGGLICWENYMPLAKHALYAWGMQILVAPTWDRGEPWLSTMRHGAKEGRVFAVSCCSAVKTDDIPDRYAFKTKYLPADLEWVNPGLSVIVNPDGKIVAGPAENEETILYASVDQAELTGPRFQLDVAGHYGRPDVFDLTVYREARPMVRSKTIRQKATSQSTQQETSDE